MKDKEKLMNEIYQLCVRYNEMFNAECSLNYPGDISHEILRNSYEANKILYEEQLQIVENIIDKLK
jgi:hypothetical protein